MLAAGALLLTGVVTPTLIASAAPPGMLTEQEPNDTYLEADGPIPAAGYVASINNPQDTDLFLLNLQPQRQVTLTLRRTCKSSAGFSLTRSDGKEAINFGSWSSETSVKSWTTPAVAAEYVGRYHGTYQEGCQVSFVLTPADAVIEGPLPERPPRALTLAPLDVVQGQPFTAEFTGSGYGGDYLQVWRTNAGSTCSRLPSAGKITAPVPQGAFDIPVTLEPVDDDTSTLCAALRNPETDLITPIVLAAPAVARKAVALAPTSRIIRIVGKRKAVWNLACRLPAGEWCIGDFSLSGPGGRQLTQQTRLPAGRSATRTFKVPRAWAAATRSGTVKVRMTGTVQRANGALVTLAATKLRLKR